MKPILLVVVSVLASFILLYPTPQPTIIEKPEWCFYAEFETIKHYYSTVPPADTIFIKLNGKRVHIYVCCSDAYWSQ